MNPTETNVQSTRAAFQIICPKRIEENLLDPKQYNLARTDHLEVSQIMLHPEETCKLPPSIKDRIIHVLVGRIILDTEGIQTPLVDGQLAILAPQRQFELRAVDEASILCSLALPDEQNTVCSSDAASSDEALDRALEDSFPASDAPISIAIAS